MKFQRGPDRIARGTVDALLRAVRDDDGSLAEELLAVPRTTALPLRAAAARSLILNANSPKGVVPVLELIGDRLEGRPVQRLAHEIPSRAIFFQEGHPPPGVTAPAAPSAAPEPPAREALGEPDGER